MRCDPNLTLWAGTVGVHVLLGERVRAAAACGYTAVSLLPTEELRHPAQARATAASLGIQLSVLDPVVSWLGEWEPPNQALDQGRLSFMKTMAQLGLDEVVAHAAMLGCASITVIEPYGRPLPLELGAEALATACDKAAEHGLEVRLEPMPFTGVADLRSAWSIVQAAGRANGGLVLDTWHFFRSASELDVLDEIPMSRLSVQLSDAPAEADSDLWEESSRRLLPGAGELDLGRVLKLLRTRGFSGPIGPEVVSPALWALGPTEAAGRAAAACRSMGVVM
ncbi:sugar phosphate isomerase/epimerase family protein [Amycolatopsis circi]|uniref:sugar phosphate isomerase/epimerase family protein n=1 Tax=Amycolatopsis circi TaxID=871959 RepID=UPI0013BEA178|nr:sugar phosphate isomerase/epimerase family protein [Amycolatopsis circi]